METTNHLHLMNASDHAELTLIRRRAEYLELKSDTVIWRNRELREQIEQAYAEVNNGIGVKATMP